MIENKFTWIQTHKDINNYLSTREDKQKEIIDLLKSVGITPLNDKEKDGKVINLEEIDPFSFYCYIYKYGAEKNLENLQKVAKKIDAFVPEDISGLPSAQPQKVWLFPYKYNRVNNEIKRLWSFFKKVLNGQIEENDFEDVLEIKNIGKAKLTEALFYVNPEKYLPIDGPTTPYINEELGINPEFNNFSDYLNILENVNKQTTEPFYEISDKAWIWRNEMKQKKYWVFQANPKIYDVLTALKDNAVNTWSVKAHLKEIKEGDKIILWVTGDKKGCYALGEVKSEIYEGPDDEDQLKYYSSNSKNEISTRVRINIYHNMLRRPITQEQIEGNKKLANLKVGSQGTNFSASEEQYKTLLKIAEQNSQRKYWLYAPGENARLWEEFYNNGIMGLGWDQLGDLNNYKSKEAIRQGLQEKGNTDSNKKNDTRTLYEFKEVMSIGDIVIPKKGKKEYLGYGVVTSDYFFDPTRNTYNKCRKVDWKKKGIWEKEDFIIPIKTLTDITAKTEEVNRLIEMMEIEENKKEHPMKNVSIPSLNVILYGPPGTGKTYELRNKYFKLFTDEQVKQTREEYNLTLVKDLAWWEVISVVMLDLKKAKVIQIFEHPLLSAKNETSTNKSPRNTIWAWLQRHTKMDCKNVNSTIRDEPLYFWKDENSEWSIDQDIAKKDTPELFDVLENYKNFSPKIVEEKRYVFTTFHQSYSYEDFVEGIKPVMTDDDKSINEHIKYEITPGILKQIAGEAINNPNKKYALFIDEINRGNIANIFGELITLIETDKRLGNDQELVAKLPYSKETFGVPSNLYIIGTMNTADRSVEALDTALRRRFCFEELPPLYDLKEISRNIDGIKLSDLLKKINQRIEKLLSKDQMIGHSYFININNTGELKFVFQNNIVPLLQEYFYGDTGKIGLVLGQEFFEEFNTADNYQDDIFAEFSDRDNYSELIEKRVYHLKNVLSMSDAEFIDAIKLLLK